MKIISVLIMTLLLSSAALAAGTWKTILNENLFPNAPMYREIQIPNTAEYSMVRIYVGMGTLRVQNVTVLTDSLFQYPLWALHGDYRSPRTAEANFISSKLRTIRLDLRSLETRGPTRVQILIR
jgi:hypothetical protein